MQKKSSYCEPSYIRLLLRSFICTSRIYIYLIYLKNKFKYPENIASKKTDIVLEGYPRSGNSYLYLLIKQIIPKIKISSHTHALAHIKLGFSLNKKVIILIRHPLSCCTSRLIFQNNLTPMLALKDYISFYSYIKKNKNKVLIINADKMFSDNDYILSKLKSITHKEISDLSIDQQRIFLDLKKENDKISQRHETIGFPTIKKNELKKIYEKKILSSHRYNILLKQCNSLYDELKDI